MIYVMSSRLYWNYINGSQTQAPMKHVELIVYLNRSLSLRGTITEIQTSN